MHGSIRKGESSQDERKDENVFENITQGVSINIFVKHLKKQPKNIVKYCELWGKRNEKYALLLEENFKNTNWQILTPKEPNWFFIPKNTNIENEYNNYMAIADVFTIKNSGIETQKDSITIQFTDEELDVVINDIIKLSEDTFKQKYKISDSRDWKFKLAREDAETHQKEKTKIQYRPFDQRYTLFTGKSKGFVAYPRTDIMEHLFKNNLSLVTCRQLAIKGFHHVFVSKNICERCLVSIKTKELGYVYPLYLYENSNQSSLLNTESCRPNLAKEFLERFPEIIGLSFVYDGKGDLKISFGPESVFYYAYSIFNSPTYRTRYAEQLQTDFPRLPLTSNKKLFADLVCMGNELVNLHLLGDNPFDNSETIFDEPIKWGIKIDGIKPDKLSDWQVSDIRYEEKDKRVYINKGQYFEGVEKDVWEFMIGSYQVCDKWLKERKKAERALSTEDLKHYMKIVVSLRETIRVMSEIDRCINDHGGWPIK